MCRICCRATTALAVGLLLRLAALPTPVVGQDNETAEPQENINGSPTAAPPHTTEPPCEPITEVLRNLDFLSLTYQAVQSAGLLSALGSPAPFVTLLAPTNQAFREAAQQLGLSSIQELLGKTPLIRRIVEQHLLPFIIDLENLKDGDVLLTLDFGNPVIFRERVPTVTFSGTGGSTNQMRLSLDYDICSATVIVVDSVLIPADVFLSDAFLVSGMDGNRTALGAGNITTNNTLAVQVASTLSSIGVESSPDTAAAANASAEAQPLTSSTTLEEADYDLSDFGVDIPGVTGGIPSVGVRVPPLPGAQAQARSSQPAAANGGASFPQRDIRPLQQQNPTQPGQRAPGGSQGAVLRGASGAQSAPKPVQVQSGPGSYTRGLHSI